MKTVLSGFLSMIALVPTVAGATSKPALSISSARDRLTSKLGAGSTITNFQHAQRSWATPHANTKGFVFSAKMQDGGLRLGKMSPTGRITFFKLNASSPDEK
jgi:hypothetical protein